MAILTNSVNRTIEQLTSVAINFVIVFVTGAFIALFFARLFGAKSKQKRQVIFGIISFISLCIATYYAMFGLKNGS